jgi:hypothetical protein
VSPFPLQTGCQGVQPPLCAVTLVQHPPPARQWLLTQGSSVAKQKMQMLSPIMLVGEAFPREAPLAHPSDKWAATPCYWEIHLLVPGLLPLWGAPLCWAWAL